MKNNFKLSYLLYPAIIALCFFYTGSAYMSQMYLLMDYYSYETVDLITSGLNYGLQALGMLLFILGFKYINKIVHKKYTFLILLLMGVPAMAGMLLTNSGLFITLYGVIFHTLVGFYFGYYLTMLSAFAHPGYIGLSYGVSYAIASVGTYLISLIDNGCFLTGNAVVVVYIVCAIVTMILVAFADDIEVKTTEKEEKEIPKDPDFKVSNTIIRLSIIIALMSLVSSVGSGLYLSLPGTESANFNLARAFYALGLITAGFIIDKNRQLGSILTLASLTYPLIATSLLYHSENGTVAMCLSYLFIGFIAVYRVMVFSDLKSQKAELLAFATFGLMISRCMDVVVTLVLRYIPLSFNVQMFISMLLYSALLVVFIIYLIDKNTKDKSKAEAPTSTPDRDAALGAFSQRYGLTARESEIVASIRDGLSDSEIAAKYFISKSTVRFHISNLLKKTGCSSRVEVVRKLLQNK